MNTYKSKEEILAGIKAKDTARLAVDVNFSLQDLCDYTKAVQMFLSQVWVTKDEDVCRFLMATVDTQEDGVGIQTRWKLIVKHDWALQNAVRDWHNIGEMGK